LEQAVLKPPVSETPVLDAPGLDAPALPPLGEFSGGESSRDKSCRGEPSSKRRRPERLTRRAEFLDVAKGKRLYAKGFALQAAPQQTKAAPRQIQKAAPREIKAAPRQIDSAPPSSGFAPPSREPARDEPPLAPRFGFTVTKKLGGAVLRNRIRRRLKEALRRLDPLPARPAHDYVILARPEALDMAFSALQAELARALKQDPKNWRPGPRKDQAKPKPSAQDPRPADRISR
jgi:ribonuclease P protein component